MFTPSYSVLKRAISRIDTPKDFDAILRQAGLERRTRSRSRLIFGSAGFFALGVVAGSAAGLFFAPKRGKEMRKQVRDQVRHKLPMGNTSSIPGQEKIYDELN